MTPVRRSPETCKSAKAVTRSVSGVRFEYFDDELLKKRKWALRAAGVCDHVYIRRQTFTPIHLLLFGETSRLLCSSSFLLPAFCDIDVLPDGVLVRLVVPDLVADTKSIASLGVLDFSCSLALKIFFCDALNSSTYDHGGKTEGTARPSGSVEAYWSSSLIPAKSISFCR